MCESHIRGRDSPAKISSHADQPEILGESAGSSPAAERDRPRGRRGIARRARLSSGGDLSRTAERPGEPATSNLPATPGGPLCPVCLHHQRISGAHLLAVAELEPCPGKTTGPRAGRCQRPRRPQRQRCPRSSCRLTPRSFVSPTHRFPERRRSACLPQIRADSEGNLLRTVRHGREAKAWRPDGPHVWGRALAALFRYFFFRRLPGRPGPRQSPGTGRRPLAGVTVELANGIPANRRAPSRGPTDRSSITTFPVDSYHLRALPTSSLTSTPTSRSTAACRSSRRN